MRHVCLFLSLLLLVSGSLILIILSGDVELNPGPIKLPCSVYVRNQSGQTRLEGNTL